MTQAMINELRPAFIFGAADNMFALLPDRRRQMTVFMLLLAAQMISLTSAPFVLAEEAFDFSRLKKLSTESLFRQLDTAPRSRDFGFGDEPSVTFEVVLQELIARGGPEIQQVLEERLRQNTKWLESARQQLDAIPHDDDRWSEQHSVVLQLEHNLKLVTGVRRVQRQPDPLQLTVRPPKPDGAGTRRLPKLQVTLKNADIEKHPVGFDIDRRTGGHERWRVHVWDQDGRLLPARNNRTGFGRGWQTESLNFGDGWKTELDMSRYVDIRLPGEYTVQVLFHDDITIAHLKETELLDWLIVYRSEPFPLLVEKGPKIRIDLKPESTERARALLEALDENHEVHLVDGEYTRLLHKFVDPKSAESELLTMSWQAVPALLDALPDDKLSLRKRAWVFALLYSITQEQDLDPRWHDILPVCKWQSGNSGRGAIWGKLTPKSEQAQQEFSQRWLRFRDDYIVTELSE